MRRSLVALALLALGLAGCGGGSSGTASAPRRVTLMLDWTPNPDHVALFEAQRRGFFARRGLQVTLRAPADATTPLKLLAAGKADLAISYEPELFFAAAQGLPVVAVASVIPEPLDTLISSRPLASLRGRSVGITGVPTDDAFLATILAHQHVAPNDIRVVHVGYNLLPALLSGKVDAILGGFRNVEGIQLRQRGLHPSIVPVDRAGVPPYDELVLAASRTRLRHDPRYGAEVRAVVLALAEGDAAARTDPASALAATAAMTESPRSFLERSVPATVSLLRTAPCLSRRAWQGFAGWMTDRKLLKTSVPVADVMTTAYLPRSCPGP